MVWRFRKIVTVTASEESNPGTAEGRQRQQHEQHADAAASHAEKHDPGCPRVSHFLNFRTFRLCSRCYSLAHPLDFQRTCDCDFFAGEKKTKKVRSRKMSNSESSFDKFLQQDVEVTDETQWRSHPSSSTKDQCCPMILQKFWVSPKMGNFDRKVWSRGLGSN